MGIYIFNWKLLRKILLADMKNPDSHHDFGKDVIPCLLNDNKTLAAYKFKGYWKMSEPSILSGRQIWTSLIPEMS